MSVVEMTSGLLPGADRDLVNVLHKRLEKLFAAIMLNTKVLNVAEAPEGIRVVLEGDVTPKEQTFDRAGRGRTAAELEDSGARFHACQG